MHAIASDTPLPPRRRHYARLRPALLTVAFVCLMLGLFLSLTILMIAWVRTPQALYASVDPRLPRVVRGGESFRALLPWFRSELWPGVALILAGAAGIVALRRREPETFAA